MLGKLWDDAVEIASTPLKLGGKLLDDVYQYSNIEDWVNSTKDRLKIKSGECPRCERQMKKIDGVGYGCVHCEHVIEF